MYTIPSTFSEDNENYITLIGLKSFCKENGLTTTVNRKEAISNIEKFANMSKTNCDAVNDWLDKTLVEGIKDIVMDNIEDPGILGTTDEKRIKDILDGLLVDSANRHYNNRFSADLKIFKYEIDDEKNVGKRIRIYMGKLIDAFDKKLTSSMLYPIFVEYYVEKKIIVARAKSKSNIYEHMATFDIETAKSTTAEKEMSFAIKHICNIFGASLMNRGASGITNRKRLFEMLDRYTKTPSEIEELVSDNSENIKDIVDTMMSACSLPITFRRDLNSDVSNMVEKYLSISYKDKSIFTKNRDIYPLQLSATDEEESKIQQTAAVEEPLQSKAVFFDNKKMLQNSRMCDEASYACVRKNSRYCNSGIFKVKISSKKAYCTMKFYEYTSEEDMIYVLRALAFPESIT